MNRYFLAFLVLATAFEFQARELTPDEALQRVQSASTRMNAPRRIAASAPKLVYTVKSTLDDRDATAYLFANSGKEKGYLLLSAEDTFEPVIGYSNTATITNPDDMPDDLKWWLSEVGREADYAIRHNAVLKAPASLGPAVEPLLKSQWGQGDPYNLFTPEIDGQHAPTGCVATAMAQIMYYHQWPQKPQGSHSYEWNGQTLSINYDELQFDWDKMTETYGGDSSQESKEAVATLMKAVGYGVDMNYSIFSSGASPESVSGALANYFRFSPYSQYAIRDIMPDWLWHDMLYSNISNGLPVYYGGLGSGGSHAFICDGYDGNGYFHFNWGLDVEYNGYFQLVCLEPSCDAMLDYSFGQSMIVNIRPDNGKNYKDYEFVNIGEFTFDGEIFIGRVVFNVGVDEIELGVGIKIKDALEYEYIPLRKVKSDATRGSGEANWIVEELDKSQEYEFELFWRRSAEEEWQKTTGCNSGITVFKDEKWVCTTNPIGRQVDSVEISDVQLSCGDTILFDKKETITYKVKNISDNAVTVVVSFDLINSNYDVFLGDMGLINFKPGEERVCSAAFSIPSKWNDLEGEYELQAGVSYRQFIIKDFPTVKLVKGPNIVYGGLRYLIIGDNEVSLIGTEANKPIADDVIVPDKVYSEGKEYNVTGIENFYYKIFNWREIKSIEIQVPITEIDDYAFNKATKLERVVLPGTVKSIGKYAFANCSELAEINLPESLNEINECAFLRCSKLMGDLIIPNTVTEIGDFAFYGCSGFTGSLTLGNSIQTIGDSAFSWCTGFNDKWIVPDLKGLKYVGKDALSCFHDVICLQEDIPECYVEGAFGSAVVRVKPGFGNKYRAHENWSGYSIYEFGDANWSESLTVTDAVADANYIIGGNSGYPFDFDCGDINMSGEISIADVTDIIKAVAEYNPAGLDASAVRAQRHTGGTLEVDDFLLNGGTAEVGVWLHSEHPVVALQADFVCGEGIEIEDMELSPKLAGSHALVLTRFEDEGIVRAIIYSLDNRVIDIDNELLTLHVSGGGTGKIEAERILASTAEASEYSFGFIGGENLSTSGFGEIGSTVRIFGADGCVRILNAEGTDIVIYDIAGRKIKAMMADSSEVKCPLQSGLYIVTVGNINVKIAL